MTRSVKTTLLALLLAFVATTTVAVAKPTKAELLEIDKQWRTARQNLDMQAIDAMLAPEFVAIDDHGDVMSRAEFLAWVKKAKITGWSEPASEYTVKLHDNVALVSTKSNLTGTFVYKNGVKKLQLKTRSTRVYVNEGGTWKLALVQYVARP